MKFGVIYDFRNPRQWRRPYPELYREILDQIVRAKELGYDNVWFAEHHFADDGYNPSPLTMVGGFGASCVNCGSGMGRGARPSLQFDGILRRDFG